MNKNLQKLINILKEKKFIFVSGYTGIGKTKLINTLRKEKEFKDYGFEEWSEYIRDFIQKSSLKIFNTFLKSGWMYFFSSSVFTLSSASFCALFCAFSSKSKRLYISNSHNSCDLSKSAF